MNVEKKAWTILIYADGNNDLAPEVYASKLKAERTLSNGTVNTIMQISLASPMLVNILRPCSNKEFVHTKAGRYLIQAGSSILLQPINKNMAEPSSLVEFIKWGVYQFPAEHYALMIGGHGYQFVGCMTDYSSKLPYIMGTVEMSDAIDIACQELNIDFDFLLLDTCYANFIETVYEYGKMPYPHIKYLLTYIMNGPLHGYPLDTLLEILQSSKGEDLVNILQQLILQSRCDMVAYKIDHKLLQQIKGSFDELAKQYRYNSGGDAVSLPSLFGIQEDSLFYHDVVRKIKQLSEELILFSKVFSDNSHSVLNVANCPSAVKSVCRQYQRLSFCENNAWAKLIIGEKEEAEQNPKFAPVMLPPQAVYAYISIMNKEADELSKKIRFQNLVLYKGWNIRM